MKLVRHGTQVVAIIEQGWEKAYLLSQQGKQEWVSMFLVGEERPFAEIHSATRQVRLVNVLPSEQVWPSDVSTCPPM
jgi:hypothetical protein